MVLYYKLPVAIGEITLYQLAVLFPSFRSHKALSIQELKVETEDMGARLTYSIPLTTFISDKRSMFETISVNSGRSYKQIILHMNKQISC